MVELNKLYNMDCLEGMKQIADKSVDMILCDLPYGTTACKWDSVIPFEPLWEQYNRITKQNAAIVMFSAQPFTTDLINSNRKMFRYEIIWEKTVSSGFFHANQMPLRIHENICVFYNKLPTYNPIKHIRENSLLKIGTVKNNIRNRSKQYNLPPHGVPYIETGERYPTDVIKFANWNGGGFIKSKTREKTSHPTQKPVPLCEYLINTYTNEGSVVLDNCMGSGTTAIAAIRTGRNWIGFEKDKDYFNSAVKRIETEISQIKLCEA